MLAADWQHSELAADMDGAVDQGVDRFHTACARYLKVTLSETDLVSRRLPDLKMLSIESVAWVVMNQYDGSHLSAKLPVTAFALVLLGLGNLVPGEQEPSVSCHLLHDFLLRDHSAMRIQQVPVALVDTLRYQPWNLHELPEQPAPARIFEFEGTDYFAFLRS
jgi:hypothetical protein